MDAITTELTSSTPQAQSGDAAKRNIGRIE